MAIQELCHQYDALFVVDEVQTGGGATGTPWCYQQLGLAPDLVAFGKKVQLGGVMAGRRVDEVAENVFRTPGRIDSTWGGNLTDMVRSRRLLELVEQTGAIANAARLASISSRGSWSWSRHSRRLSPTLVGAASWPRSTSDARLRSSVLSMLWGEEP